MSEAGLAAEMREAAEQWVIRGGRKCKRVDAFEAGALWERARRNAKIYAAAKRRKAGEK